MGNYASSELSSVSVSLPSADAPDFIRNGVGRICVIGKKFYILTSIKGAPILVVLNPFQIQSNHIYETEAEAKKAITSKNECGNVFFLHVFWNGDNPRCLNYEMDGEVVQFDAHIHPTDNFYQSLIVWQHHKPNHTMLLENDSYLFIKKFTTVISNIDFHESMGNVTFQVGKEAQTAVLRNTISFMTEETAKDPDWISKLRDKKKYQATIYKFIKVEKHIASDFYVCGNLFTKEEVDPSTHKHLQPKNIYNCSPSVIFQLNRKSKHLFTDLGAQLRMGHKSRPVIYLKRFNVTLHFNPTRIYKNSKRVDIQSIEYPCEVIAHVLQREFECGIGVSHWEVVCIFCDPSPEENESNNCKPSDVLHKETNYCCCCCSTLKSNSYEVASESSLNKKNTGETNLTETSNILPDLPINMAHPLINKAKPSNNPIDPSINPVDPANNPADPAINRLDPAINQLDPAINQLDPAINQLDPAINQLDPAINPVDPAINPVDPAINPVNPAINPVDPAVNPRVPAINPPDPAINPVGPTVDPVRPAINLVGPAINPTDPAVKHIDPAINPADPLMNSTYTKNDILKIFDDYVILKFPNGVSKPYYAKDIKFFGICLEGICLHHVLRVGEHLRINMATTQTLTSITEPESKSALPKDVFSAQELLTWCRGRGVPGVTKYKLLRRLAELQQLGSADLLSANFLISRISV